MSDWKEDENKLWKEFKFNSYIDGVNFVKTVANIAESLNHHPEIHLKYKKVLIFTTTHDKDNKITEKDKELCASIDQTFSRDFGEN